MSYVPPHKRHNLNNAGGAASSPPSPAPPPDSVMPRFQRNHNSKSEGRPKMDITYADQAISKWFAVGLVDQSLLSTFTRLEPVSSGVGPPSVTLVLTENGDEAPELPENPWVLVAEFLKQDFVLSLQKLKDVLKDFGIGKIQPHLMKDVPPSCGIRLMKPYMVVRFGKVHFHGNHVHSLEGSSLTEGALKQLRRYLWTDVPPSCIEHFSKIGLEFGEEKDNYLIKISDNTQSGAILSCKCAVDKETNRLQLYKIEVSRMRYLVEDVSCIGKNVDVRVQLLSKRRLFVVEDEDFEKIKSLVSYAMLDSEVKGGLRWPLGKLSLCQFSVVNFSRTNSRTFTNSSMKLRLRYVDRYDLRTSEGQVSPEVYIKMPGIVSQLVEETFDPDNAFEMLKENLEFIWKHFLC